MSESDEQRPPGEFARLAEYARGGSVLATPERIRVLGMRRLRRHRAGYAVLGTGAVAAAVFLGAGFAPSGSGSGHSAIAPAAGSSTSGATPTPSRGGVVNVPPGGRHSSPTPVQYVFPQSVFASRGTVVLSELHDRGFADVRVETVASDTIPAGNAIDIDDAQHHSLLGEMVAVNTPLTLLVSAGPSSPASSSSN